MQPRLQSRAALVILTALNFFNYIDRYVLPAVQPLVKDEFHISDADLGFLTTAFFFVYMLAAPVMGFLADRYSRKWIVFGGAILWSGATLLTAVTHDFTTLLVRHTIVGIGEAAFATITPTLIADSFPQSRRGRMLSLFYLAIPAGTALGYILGGYLGHHYGWRNPFYVVAGPGFVLAFLLLFVAEPKRGQNDLPMVGIEPRRLTGLARNGAFLSATLGMAMLTFALGGISVWMPTFLSRVRGLPLERANVIFGGITVVDGIVATLIGGWLGDRLLRRTAAAYYLVSAMGMAIALPFVVLAIYATGKLMFAGIIVGEFFVLLNTGPLNAAIVNSVGAHIRATALAVNLFTIHILGDAFSPTLMGAISDRHSLQAGFAPAIVAIAISAAILFFGMRFAPKPANTGGEPVPLGAG